jgi:putative ABC transport system ATP-binding protein
MRASGARTLSLPHPVQAAGAVVALRDVVFAWTPGAPPVLRIPAFAVAPGERVFLRGPSGSGKSTLLNLLAGVMVPQSGTVSVLGQNLCALGGAARDRHRADHVGFVFQLFNLIPYLSVAENVTLPCLFSARRRGRAIEAGGSVEGEALRLLGHLGLAGAATLRRPVTELSVGQQQRVAAARALIGAPGLVIADEATSALDADLREAFLELLFRECARTGAAVVFVSHDASLARLFDRTIELAAINAPA